MTMGKIIQTARKEVGLTQVQLGKRLGVSGAMIGQWENDLRKPKSETIGRIADALGEPFIKLYLQYSKEWSEKTKELLETMHAEDAARFGVLAKEADKAFQEKTASFTHSPIGRSIIYCFYELNELGQKEAEKRIYELAEIPKYQYVVPKNIGDTAQKGNPPEGEKKPNDGE